MRNGVDPAEPASPNGWTSSTVSPSWSRNAWRMACAAGTPDIQVRGPPPPIGHREGLVRGEQAKPEQRDGHADDHTHQHIGGRLHSQVDVGDGHHRHQARRRPTSRVVRQRPSGTSPYRIPTSVTASAAICSDGSAHARQSVRNSTPNGRGRRSSRRQHVLDDHALQDPSDHDDQQLPQAPAGSTGPTAAPTAAR